MFVDNPSGQSKKFSFFYDVANGDDFDKNLPRVLRNVKSAIKRHIVESQLHCDAVKFETERSQEEEARARHSKRAGLSLGRLAYAMLFRGRPLFHFTMDVLVSAKNGATVGDIIHSKYFIKEFSSQCALNY